MSFDTTTLTAGDHLLYGAHDFAGWVTSVKTWSPAVHVETYVGANKSVASRNGIGVGFYDYRPDGLVAVLEPKETIDIAAGMVWFNHPFNSETSEGVCGRPYGWRALLRFYNIHLNTDGWICSEFTDLFDMACGFYPFAADYYAGCIDPGDYFVSNAFNWKWMDGYTLKQIRKL